MSWQQAYTLPVQQLNKAIDAYCQCVSELQNRGACDDDDITFDQDPVATDAGRRPY
jgi:hypothetical protein